MLGVNPAMACFAAEDLSSKGRQGNACSFGRAQNGYSDTKIKAEKEPDLLQNQVLFYIVREVKIISGNRRISTFDWNPSGRVAGEARIAVGGNAGIKEYCGIAGDSTFFIQGR